MIETAKSRGDIGGSCISATEPASRRVVTNPVKNVGDGVVALHRFAAQKLGSTEPLHSCSAQIRKVEPDAVSAPLVVFAALDVSPVDLAGIVEFNPSDIIPNTITALRMFCAVADVQHALIFFKDLSPFGARVVTLRERLRFFPPGAMTVALRAAHVRRRTIGFHCRVIFGIGEAFG